MEDKAESKSKLKSAAIVLAGGRGSRMGGDIPKQYMMLGEYPIIYYSLKAFEDSFVDEIVLVCGAGDEDYCRENIVSKYDFRKVKSVVAGGKERYHSVACGLNAIAECDIVFIHDGARPFVTQDIIKRSFDETVSCHATVVAVPSKDTVKIADEDGFAIDTPRRDCVWNVQTPQTFCFGEIKDAYDKLTETEDELKEKGIVITDDAMVMEHFGASRVKLVMGSYSNIKITTPEDIMFAKSFM